MPTPTNGAGSQNYDPNSPLTYAELMAVWIAGGGPSGTVAAIAAAIALAESGGIPSTVQKYGANGKPVTAANQGWGLWQITPGTSEPSIGINAQLLSPIINARAAVAKYRAFIAAGFDGFQPWVTYTQGTYLHFFQKGVAPSGYVPGGPGDQQAPPAAPDISLATQVAGLALPAVGSVPGINGAQAAAWTPEVSNADWVWPYNLYGQDLAAHVTTESNVDLTQGSLSQVQLTIVDPTYEVTASLAGHVKVLSGAFPPPVMFKGAPMSVTELQTTDVNGVPAVILSLSPAFLAWAQGMRNNWVLHGKAGQVLREMVAYFNAHRPHDLPAIKVLSQINGPVNVNVPGSRAWTIPMNKNRPRMLWLSWFDYLSQMAEGEGFWLFETNGTVVFGQPDWIAAQAPGVVGEVTVGWPGLDPGQAPYDRSAVDVEATQPPSVLRAQTTFTGDQMTLMLPRGVGEQMQVGQKVKMNGIHPFNNPGIPGEYTDPNEPPGSTLKWLVMEVSYAMDGGATPVQVTCNQSAYIQAPDPGGYGTPLGGPNPTQGPGTAGYTPKPGNTSSMNRVLSLAFGQSGDAYNNYVEQAKSSGAPGSFDCSGLVQWIAQQIGSPLGGYRDTAQQFQFLQAAGYLISVQQAFNTPGALVYHDPMSTTANGDQGHVAISLGTGPNGNPNLFAAWDPQLGVRALRDSEANYEYGALIPGVNYGAQSPRLRS